MNEDDLSDSVSVSISLIEAKRSLCFPLAVGVRTSPSGGDGCAVGVPRIDISLDSSCVWFPILWSYVKTAVTTGAAMDVKVASSALAGDALPSTSISRCRSGITTPKMTIVAFQFFLNRPESIVP